MSDRRLSIKSTVLYFISYFMFSKNKKMASLVFFLWQDLSVFAFFTLLSLIRFYSIGNVQGMEKDIILLATTITHAGNFATDAQRVNVAFN